MLEKEIEKKVNDHAKKTGWKQYKFVSPGRRGVPDRMYIMKGHVLFIEFKKLGGRVSALQQKEINILRREGIDCYVVDNVTEGKDVLDQARENLVSDSDTE